MNDQAMTLVLAICTLTVGLIAWFMRRMVAQNDRDSDRLDEHGERLTKVETVLEQNGLVQPTSIPYQKKSGA